MNKIKGGKTHNNAIFDHITKHTLLHRNVVHGFLGVQYFLNCPKALLGETKIVQQKVHTMQQQKIESAYYFATY